MILFRDEHVGPVLAGVKDETRRCWSRARVRVGAVHKFYVVPPFSGGAPFAAARVVAVWQEALGALSERGARREGYPSREAYFEAFARINRLRSVPLSLPVWAVRFVVVEGFVAEARRIHALGEKLGRFGCCGAAPCALAGWLAARGV